MQTKKQKPPPHDKVAALFVNFQKLFRCMDFGRSLRGRTPVLTMQQMRLLSFFNESDTVHISDVSRRLNMSMQSVNNMVTRLEAMDYVVRSQNAQDKRLSDIRFTKKGRRGFELFRTEQLGILSLLLEQLDAAEREAALKSVGHAAGLFQKAVLRISEAGGTPQDDKKQRRARKHRAAAAPPGKETYA